MRACLRACPQQVAQVRSRSGHVFINISAARVSRGKLKSRSVADIITMWFPGPCVRAEPGRDTDHWMVDGAGGRGGGRGTTDITT